MNRRGFLTGLLAAPVVASLPDVLRPSLFGRAWTAALSVEEIQGALDRTRAAMARALRRRPLLDQWSADLDRHLDRHLAGPLSVATGRGA